MSKRNMPARDILSILGKLKEESVRLDLNIDFEIDRYLFQFSKKEENRFFNFSNEIMTVTEFCTNGDEISLSICSSMQSVKRFRRFMVERQFGLEFRENLDRITLLLA